MKIRASIFGVLFAALAMNAAAYFDGGASVTTGPDGYRGTDLNLTIGTDNFFVTPSYLTYDSDSLTKSFSVYKVRAGKEADMYAVAGEAGFSSKNIGYQYKFFGGDVTFSLTPGKGGKSRLAGPGARSVSRGGQGVTRIDVGAALKRNIHSTDINNLSKETGQTEYSIFAGAKILMAQLGASYTGYSYGSDKVLPLLESVPGHNFVLSAYPKSSVSARLDFGGYPMVTPFVSYTKTQYKFGVKDSSAYLFGAYIDLSMIAANIGYQIFDNGNDNDSFLSIGAGLKF